MLSEMGNHGFLESTFNFCCATIAELGNILDMSYQKVNVILFCYVEPILFLVGFLTLIYVLLRIPGHSSVGKIIYWLIWTVIIAVVLTIGSAAIHLWLNAHSFQWNPANLYESLEPSATVNYVYNEAVKWLYKCAEFFHTSYEMVNIWVYIIIMPIGILCSLIILWWQCVRRKRN